MVTRNSVTAVSVMIVVNDISFEVKPGQSVALVGQTGSGKSTIGKLLTRAYDGFQGQISVIGSLNRQTPGR